MPRKQLLTTDDVAEILGVSPSTLVRWRQTGEPDLCFLRINGRIRYRAEDVQDFLDAAESDQDEDDDDADDEEDIDEDDE
jgi:excisionase family DNA binding protein